MDPINLVPDISVPDSKPNNRISQITVISMAAFILMALAIVGFLYYQNRELKSMLAKYQTQPTPSPIAIATIGPTPAPDVVITSPLAGAKVASPLKITGTVPAGWVFEGVFPIKLIDSTGATIVEGQAKEKVPGSWQNGTPVDFTATLTFKDASGTATLILSKDNPSGNPDNDQDFDVPLNFSEPTSSKPKACTLEAKICPDGSSVGRTGPNCEFAPCPTY